MGECGRPPLPLVAHSAYIAFMTASSTTTHPAVRVRDLRKSYGENEAVRGVSFEVARGEVFCLLGPNGAGKTTTVEILEGYRTRTSGRGARPRDRSRASGSRELRERVGIVLQECGVQADLTVARADRDVRPLLLARGARSTS